MKTDFQILWVDDNKDFVDSLVNPLITWMEEYGFSLVVYLHKSEAGVENDLKTKDIELIVLDYKLRGNKKGDEIIKSIRDKNYYQDIVFYSQDAIPDAVFSKSFDGVFHTDRKDAKDCIKALIALKIKRASDLATFRGWVVADSIELESVLGRVLSKCFKAQKEVFKKCVLAHEGLFDFYKTHMVLNSLLHDRMEDLKKAGDAASLPKVQACKKILDAFPDEIIHIRNALAHQVAEDDEAGHKKIKVKGKGKEFLNTPENLIKIRKDLKKHRDNLLELEAIL
jgi:CheY-like chemotaxis protein